LALIDPEREMQLCATVSPSDLQRLRVLMTGSYAAVQF